MSKNRRFVGAIVLFSAFAVGMPPADAVAGQGRGKAKKAEKAEDKREKRDDKHEKAEDKHERKDRKDDRKDRDDHRDDDRDHRRDGRRDDKVPVVVVDRDGHVRVIREFAHSGSLPPGLAKRESLPPGLRRQLRERGELPPGLQKRLVPVPAVLVTRLPAVPSYYTRYFAGDDFIVVDTRTNRIIAIVRDVWR